MLDKLREMAGPDAGYLASDAERRLPRDQPQRRLPSGAARGRWPRGVRDLPGRDPRGREAGVVFYLDFDASDDWLLELAGDDAEAKANLAPLAAVGMSAWQEDGIAHGVLRVTTDE